LRTWYMLNGTWPTGQIVAARRMTSLRLIDIFPPPYLVRYLGAPTAMAVPAPVSTAAMAAAMMITMRRMESPVR
jgi:hypothetical protein